MEELEEFKCDVCQAIFTIKSNLGRHYKNVHGAIPKRYKDLPARKHHCEACDGEFCDIYKHRRHCKYYIEQSSAPGTSHRHPLSCPKTPSSKKKLSGLPTPSSKRPKTPPAGAGALSEEDSSEDEENENQSKKPAKKRETFYDDTISKNIPIPNDDEVLNDLENFIIKIDKRAKSTASQYVSKIKHFLRFQKKKDANFSLARCQMQHIRGANSCVYPSEWIADFPDYADSNVVHSLSAYIKLIDFTIHNLQQKLPLMEDRNVFRDHKMDLDALRDQCKRELRQAQKGSEGKKQSRQAKKEEQAQDESEKEVPMDVLQECLDSYKNSEWRASYYQKLTDLRQAKEKHFIKIRNFLILETILASKGQRGEVVLKMTTENVYGSHIVEGKTDKFCMSIAEHKTSRSAGEVRIFLSRSLRNLLLQYDTYIRHRLSKVPEDPNVPFFLSNNGHPLTRSDMAMDIFVKKSSCKYQVTAKSLRRLYAYKGQSHEDASVREKLPGYMAHSRGEALKSYIRPKEKTREHLKILESFGEDYADEILPEVSEPEGVMETRRRRIRAEAEEEHQAREQREQHNFEQSARRTFDPADRKCIRNAFDSMEDLAAETESINRSTFEQARERVADFGSMVKRQIDKGKKESKVFQEVRSSYRAYKRNNKKDKK